jgi:hypothetical protein
MIIWLQLDTPWATSHYADDHLFFSGKPPALGQNANRRKADLAESTKAGSSGGALCAQREVELQQGDRIALWDIGRGCKISGGAAPLAAGLFQALERNPCIHSSI